MSQTSKHLKIILTGSLSLVVSVLAMACGSAPVPTLVTQPTRDSVNVANVPPPTPTTPASPTPPPAIIAPDDGCVVCHTDQERLIATADQDEVIESLSEGEG